MNKLTPYFLTLLLLMCSYVGAGAVRNTRFFNSKDIVSSTYGGFCLDGEGYLWIGTQYGLLRFDGINFDRYRYEGKDTTSLSDNRINKILRDKDDRLWIATCEGLNLYNPDSDSFIRIQLPGMDLNGYISEIYQSKSGDIIFMVAGIGLYVIDFSSGEPLAVKYMPQIELSRTINTLSETCNGDIVGGNHAGELVIISPNGQSTTVRLTDHYIRILLSDKKGHIFIATTSRAWMWSVADNKFDELKIEGVSNPVLDNAVLTASGDILVGTMGHGLLYIDREDRVLRPYRELSNPIIDIDKSRVSTVYEDSNGNLWLGCSHQGIVMAPLSESPVNYISLNRHALDYTGGAIKVAVMPGSDNIWIGLEDGRLLEADGHGNISLVHRFPEAIGSMMVSRTGKLYLGVNNQGLFEYIPATSSIRHVKNIEGHYIASALAEDNENNIYIGIHGEGVMCFNPLTGNGEWLGNNSDFNPRWTSALYCDTRGNLWIGSYGGLGVYNPVTATYDNISKKRPEMIKGVHNAISEDSCGNIWSASSNGLFIINPDEQTFKHLSAAEGLCDSSVSTIVFDRDGDAWVGTHDGINRIDSALHITSFYGRNDIEDSDYFSATVMSDGQRLLFSGEKGLTLIDPVGLKNFVAEREIMISSIHLNGKKINASSTSSNGKRIIDGDIKSLELSHLDNSLTLYLSTKDFKNNDNLVFQWCIPGFVDEWVTTPAGSGVVTLPHLRHGNHTVRLRTVENGLITASESISVHVDSPWYLTIWAKMLYLIAIIAVILLIGGVIRQKNVDHIKEEKIKFFINISHEIRSPLTLILGPLEQLMKKEHDQETVKHLNLIHRNANRILALINQLLDIRKMDKGKMELQYSDTELVNFTRDLVDIFQSQASEKGIALGFATDGTVTDGLNVRIDRNNFDKVLVNLITNAIKYTPKGGEVTVKVGSGYDNSMGDYAEISVIDNGIGLDEKNIHRLFDRFYQGKFNKGSVPLGFGIGLDLCRQLVELHHGTIAAANRRDVKGSVFTVCIPLSHRQSDIHDTDESATTRAVDCVASTSYAPVEMNRTGKNTSLNILVVDDDAEIRTYLADVLSNLGKITEATNGEEALRKIKDNIPDLIISDVVMPGMDGLTLLKTLKSNIDTNYIPVILLSSKNDVADRMKGWDRGADGYIGKPFNANELMAIVDSLVDNRLRLRGKFSGVQEQDARIETPVIKGNDATLIDKIVQEISDRLDDPNLNVETLCANVGLSRAHLNRKMKELFGLSPSEFIRNMRLRKACELLKQGDIDISQIAYSVGFTSQPHFSTAFKRFTGFTPSEYRMDGGKSDGK